jgi:N6-adenosine-specific RNA methylase IME4
LQGKAKENQGTRTDLTSVRNLTNVDTKKELATLAGVSHDTIAKVKVIEQKADEETKEKLSSGEVSINQAYKEIKQAEKKQELEQKKQEYAERVQEISLLKDERKIDIFETDKKFRVIYADPPWSYNDKCESGAVQSGGVEVRHYDTMSIDQLCDLRVDEITEKNSVLFLWVTSPLLDECFEVVKAWGFKYKASFVWDKVRHNMGHYNSVRHEFLLICTKGSCLPDEKKLIDSVQSIEKTDKHSEKPVEFMNIIDELYTHGDRIELFCRQSKKENWFYWGNEV